jgi:chitin deacetylase
LYFICFNSFWCWSQSTFDGNSVQIGFWKDFKRSAVSITFDDGNERQFYGAMPIMDSLGIKGTFYVVCEGSEVIPWDYLNEAAKRGHEIGSHTVHHVVLFNVSDEVAEVEARASKEIILKRIKNQTQPFTFCYPGGYSDKRSRAIISKYYIAARGVRNHYNSDTTDVYQLRTQWAGSRTTYKSLNAYLNFVLRNTTWMIEMYHGFDGQFWDPIPLELFRKHMIDIAKNSDKLWIAPVRDVVRYRKERQSAVVSFDSITESKITFYLNDTLDDQVFDLPLSLKVLLPLEWSNLIVKQGDSLLCFKIENYLDNNFVLFNALPNNQLISIQKILNVTNRNYNYFLRAYPVPFNDNLNIDLISPNEGSLKIYIADAVGIIKYIKSFYVVKGMNSINLSTFQLKSGNYFISAELEGQDILVLDKIKVLK